MRCSCELVVKMVDEDLEVERISFLSLSQEMTRGRKELIWSLAELIWVARAKMVMSSAYVTI